MLLLSLLLRDMCDKGLQVVVGSLRCRTGVRSVSVSTEAYMRASGIEKAGAQTVESWTLYAVQCRIKK